ncbi:MAG: hypothetical protein R2712_22155 [Vicinamibacterales bacterium]
MDDRGGTKAKMGPEIYAAIIDEAHAQGLPAIAHVYYLDDAKGLVRAGVDGLAHMVRAEPGVDDELVALMKAHGTVACTTMSIQRPLVDGPEWLDDPALAETQTPETLAAWRAGVAAATPEAVARAEPHTLSKPVSGGTPVAMRIVLCGDTG